MPFLIIASCDALCIVYFDILTGWAKISREEKLHALILKKKMNTDFKISVFSNFLVPRGSPAGYQKPVKHC